jgi:hypothetical protein
MHEIDVAAFKFRHRRPHIAHRLGQVFGAMRSQILLHIAAAGRQGCPMFRLE